MCTRNNNKNNIKKSNPMFCSVIKCSYNWKWNLVMFCQVSKVSHFDISACSLFFYCKYTLENKFMKSLIFYNSSVCHDECSAVLNFPQVDTHLPCTASKSWWVLFSCMISNLKRYCPNLLWCFLSDTSYWSFLTMNRTPSGLSWCTKSSHVLAIPIVIK